MGIFDVDKSELIERVMDRYDVRLRVNHQGWQPIRCINSDAHSHGDKNPSASVNLALGYYTCHTCGLKGDGFSLLLDLEGLKAPDVVRLLGAEPLEEEETWLI